MLATSLYFAIAGAVTSAYMLGIALEAMGEVLRASAVARGSLLAVYGLSALVALVCSPRTLIRSEQEERESRAREMRWLPWALGCQGFLIGSGVFLAGWLLHGEYSREGFLLGGLAALGALILVTLSTIGFHRFFVLACSPLPVSSTDVLPRSPS